MLRATDAIHLAINRLYIAQQPSLLRHAGGSCAFARAHENLSFHRLRSLPHQGRSSFVQHDEAPEGQGGHRRDHAEHRECDGHQNIPLYDPLCCASLPHLPGEIVEVAVGQHGPV